MANSSVVLPGHENLQWVTWNGSLPNGAFPFVNTYTKTTDYICRSGGQPGYYRPSKGPYCFYPYDGKELKASSFEVLVNKGDFELLEWKAGYWGSVPENSVYAVQGQLYVGKNKYGLGKVDTKNKAFFLPWDGEETWYKSYEVLTISTDIQSQKITDVEYLTDKVEIKQQLPSAVTRSKIINNDIETVKKTVTLSYTYSESHTWNVSTSTKTGISTTVTAHILSFGSLGVEFIAEKTEDISEGATKTELITKSDSTEIQVPPNHATIVSLVGCQTKGSIPFTARLTRTYKKGEVRSTTITGTYEGAMMADFKTVVDPCTMLGHK